MNGGVDVVEPEKSLDLPFWNDANLLSPAELEFAGMDVRTATVRNTVPLCTTDHEL